MTRAKAAYRLALAGADDAGVEVTGSDAYRTVLPAGAESDENKAAARNTHVDHIGPNTHRSRP